MEIDTAGARAAPAERKKQPRGEELMEISAKEAALIVGKGGSTKKKLEAATDCRLELDRSAGNLDMVTVRIQTKDEYRKEKTREYIRLLLENKSEMKGLSRLGVDRRRDDLTVIAVPQQTVGYITGKNRSTLHSLEEETKTLMFFESKDLSRPEENLLIFSVHPRGRKQAELKVMSAIESKIPGHYLHGDFKQRYESNDENLGIIVHLMDEVQFTYALGKGGNTRRKLERSSGAIIEYVGYNAFIAGTPLQRQRGLDYLSMLLLQKDGKDVSEVLHDNRDDLTIIHVPRDLVPAVSGARGAGLRKVEDETDTFCFFESKKDGADRPYQKLYVLSESRREREIAEDIFMKDIRRHEDNKRRRDRESRRDDRRRGDDRRGDDRRNDRRRDEDRGRERGRDRNRDRSAERGRGRRRRSYSRSESSRGRSYSPSSVSSFDDRSPSRGDRRQRRSRSPRPHYRR